MYATSGVAAGSVGLVKQRDAGRIVGVPKRDRGCSRRSEAPARTRPSHWCARMPGGRATERDDVVLGKTALIRCILGRTVVTIGGFTKKDGQGNGGNRGSRQIRESRDVVRHRSQVEAPLGGRRGAGLVADGPAVAVESAGEGGRADDPEILGGVTRASAGTSIRGSVGHVLTFVGEAAVSVAYRHRPEGRAGFRR